jgi:kynureninase
LPEIAAIADGVASLIGAPAGSVALGPNASALQAALASALAFDARDEVVIEALQFPSLAYVWTAWERRGARVVTVPSDDGATIPTQRILDAITTRTNVVVLSHAYFVSSVLVDVPAIVARAREAGALVVLDVYQTAGVVPIDVAALDVDVLVGGSHKWLCGGPGCAFMYVRPALAARLESLVTGWMAPAEPFAFAAAPTRYANDARRFTNGTPTVPGYLVARPGHELVRAIGIENIRAHAIRLGARLVEGAEARGLRVSSPRDGTQRTGWVGIDIPHAEHVVRELARRRVFVDHRPGCGLRVSPHFYTTDDDIDAFFTEIAAVS